MPSSRDRKSGFWPFGRCDLRFLLAYTSDYLLVGSVAKNFDPEAVSLSRILTNVLLRSNSLPKSGLTGTIRTNEVCGIGLKLPPAKAPMETIVIDRVEKPSPN
jgi:hypothetical protein